MCGPTAWKSPARPRRNHQHNTESMARTGRIEGRVVAHDGTPLSEVRINLEAGLVEHLRQAAASTTEAGDYRVSDLPPGAYTVRVSSSTHGDHAARVSIRPTSTTRLDFVLPS